MNDKEIKNKMANPRRVNKSIKIVETEKKFRINVSMDNPVHNYKAGDVVTLDIDKEGNIKDKYMRRRFRDSLIEKKPCMTEIKGDK